MKKLFMSAMLAIAFATAASAQCHNRCCEQNKCDRRPEPCEQRHHPRTPEDRVERMKKNLNLTDEQCKKMTDLFTEFDKKNEELRKKHQEEMQKRRNDLDSKIEKILTDEQLKAYKERRDCPKKRPCPRKK